MSGKTVNLTRNRRLKELQGMAGYMAERIAHRVPSGKVIEIDGHEITSMCYYSPKAALMYSTLAISSVLEDWRAITALGPMGSTANIDGLEIPVADEDYLKWYPGAQCHDDMFDTMHMMFHQDLDVRVPNLEIREKRKERKALVGAVYSHRGG